MQRRRKDPASLTRTQFAKGPELFLWLKTGTKANGDRSEKRQMLDGSFHLPNTYPDIGSGCFQWQWQKLRSLSVVLTRMKEEFNTERAWASREAVLHKSSHPYSLLSQRTAPWILHNRTASPTLPPQSVTLLALDGSSSSRTNSIN